MPDEDINEKAIEVVQKELEYRRTKLWDIFSWCSTVLIAIMGGIIALKTAPEGRHIFTIWECSAITVAVLAITICAERWMTYNLDREKKIVQALNDKLDIKQLGPNLVDHPSKLWDHFQVGYRVVLGSLAIAALVVTWYGLFVHRPSG